MSTGPEIAQFFNWIDESNRPPEAPSERKRPVGRGCSIAFRFRHFRTCDARGDSPSATLAPVSVPRQPGALAMAAPTGIKAAKM